MGPQHVRQQPERSWRVASIVIFLGNSAEQGLHLARRFGDYRGQPTLQFFGAGDTPRQAAEVLQLRVQPDQLMEDDVSFHFDAP